MTWSPDGNRIAYGGQPYGLDLDNLEIDIWDPTARQTLTIPGSRGLFSPRWSRDGQHLAALSPDSHSLMLFDFSTQQWSVLLHTEDGTIGYPVWVKDGKSIYIERFQTADPAVHRLRIGESQSERFLSWNDLHRFSGVWGAWSGVAPHGSVLTVRDVSSHQGMRWICSCRNSSQLSVLFLECPIFADSPRPGNLKCKTIEAIL